MFNVKWGVKVFLLASFCVGSLFKVTVRTMCYNTLFFSSFMLAGLWTVGYRYLIAKDSRTSSIVVCGAGLNFSPITNFGH